MGTFWHSFADMAAVETGGELVVDRGEGVHVWDEQGRRYLDATAALWYCNVGYGRTEIADAVAQQIRRLAAYSTFGDLSNRPAIELAERVSALAPVPESKVFLTSGGSDSIDTATKMARRYWQLVGRADRTLLITRERAPRGDRLRRPRARSRVLLRARHRRGWGIRPARGLPGRGPCHLSRNRRPVRRRRGDHRVRAARRLVRELALGPGTRPRHLREGHHQRLPPDGRGYRRSVGGRAVLAGRSRLMAPRLHVLGPRHRRRGRTRQPRRHGARGTSEARPRAGRPARRRARPTRRAPARRGGTCRYRPARRRPAVRRRDRRGSHPAGPRGRLLPRPRRAHPCPGNRSSGRPGCRS